MVLGAESFARAWQGTDARRARMRGACADEDSDEEQEGMYERAALHAFLQETTGHFYLGSALHDGGAGDVGASSASSSDSEEDGTLGLAGGRGRGGY